MELLWLVLIPVTLVAGCVTLSNLLNLSVPQFPRPEDGTHSYFVVFWGIELIFIVLDTGVSQNKIKPAQGYVFWGSQLGLDGPVSAIVLSMLTWSSRRSSQKAGMYLAHSTRTSSCSFIDSHTSVMLAIFLARMSPLIPEMGEVICRR